MIAVLASRLDSEAQALVAAWSAAGAALLSAEDLCTTGWVFDPGDPATGTAVVAGRRVPVSALRAVLTRRPAVVAEELGQINPADRPYVAAETNAFLVAWLSALPCRVVNRPTPTSLCGPAWNHVHWQAAAGRAGVAWAEDPRGQEPLAEHAEETETLIVCGENVLFARDGATAAMARALAREAGVTLLGVRMRNRTLCGASVAPNLGDASVRAALLEHLREAS
jgi:hypothetical protein